MVTRALHEASGGDVAKWFTVKVRTSLNSGHSRSEDVAQTSGWRTSSWKVEYDGSETYVLAGGTTVD